MTARPHRLARATLSSALVLALFAGTAVGGAAASVGAPGPFAGVCASPAGPDEAAARAVLERAKSAYAALRSYSDTARMTTETEMEEEGVEAPSFEMKLGFRFARPAAAALVHEEEGGAYTDGKRMWVHMARTSEYTESDAPAGIDLETLTRDHFAIASLPHPVAEAILRDERPAPLLFPWLTSVTGVVAEEFGGRPGKRVTGVADFSDRWGHEEPFPVSLWFSDETGLLGEARYDLTAMMQKMGRGAGEDDEEDEGFPAMPRVKSLWWIVSLNDVRMDRDTDLGSYVFKPGPGDEKVDQLQPAFRMDDSDQEELLGRPAPAFAATTLKGEPLSLEGLRGKVVLIDFWATWCGPCVQAMPHIQKLSERFSGKPVVVLGISSDAPGTEDRVRKFLERRGITFPQILDDAKEIGEAYRVRGIPYTVLIDAEGVVQDLHVGFSPGHADDLAEKIERLLRGEKLYEATRARHAESDARAPADRRTPGRKLADVNPDALTAVAAPRVQGLSGHQSRRIDLDGDGLPELVTADFQGSLYIISGDGERAERVRIPGRSGETITAFQPVGGGEETQWVIVRQRWSGRGEAMSSSVSMHDASGQTLWTYTPELPEGVTCQYRIDAADLTGDGREEIVVGISAYRLKRLHANSYEHVDPESFIAVLDGAGTVLALRRIGSYGELLGTFGGRDSAPATILVTAENRVRRYRLDLSGSGLREEGGDGGAPDR